MGIITILGPDGAGKTTLAKMLAEDCADAGYLYLGQNPEIRQYRVFDQLIKSRFASHYPAKLLRAVLIYFNDWLDCRISLNSLQISDRYVFDHVVQALLHQHRGRAVIHRVLCKLFPDPDAVILLCGSASIIAARKNELSVEQTTRYIDIYRRELQRCGIEVLEVDSSRLSPTQIVTKLHEQSIV